MNTCYYFTCIAWLFCVLNMHVYNSHEIYFLLLWTLFFVKIIDEWLDNEGDKFINTCT
jgi:hypothetical protein